MEVYRIENLLEDGIDNETTICFMEGQVDKSDKYKMRIEVFGGDSRFEYVPYFKLTKEKTWRNTSINDRVRIAIEKIAYIQHNDDKGLWELNSGERKHLMEFLRKNIKGSSTTVWEGILLEAIRTSNGRYSEEKRYLPLLDYTLLPPINSVKYDNAQVIIYNK